MNDFSDMEGSAVVAQPGEMSITAEVLKGQCQFNLHHLAQRVFLLWEGSTCQYDIFKHQEKADS